MGACSSAGQLCPSLPWFGGRTQASQTSPTTRRIASSRLSLDRWLVKLKSHTALRHIPAAAGQELGWLWRDRGPTSLHMLWPCLVLTALLKPMVLGAESGSLDASPLTAFPFALSTFPQSHLSSARALLCSVFVPEHPSQRIRWDGETRGFLPSPGQGDTRPPVVPGGRCQRVDSVSSLRPWGGEGGGGGR